MLVPLEPLTLVSQHAELQHTLTAVAFVQGHQHIGVLHQSHKHSHIMHLIKLCIQQFPDVLACSPTLLESDLIVALSSCLDLPGQSGIWWHRTSDRLSLCICMHAIWDCTMSRNPCSFLLMQLIYACVRVLLTPSHTSTLDALQAT